MATLKNTIINDTGYLTIPVGNTSLRPEAPETGMMRYNTDFSITEYYNGSNWVPISYTKLIGLSAQQIKEAYPYAPDGPYRIYFEGIDSVKQIYCLMNSGYDGGGWMLALKSKDKEEAFRYDSTYWTQNNTLNESFVSLHNDVNAKYHVMNEYEGKDMMAIWPDILTRQTAGGGLPADYSSYGRDAGNWNWLELNYPQHISASTSTLINFFNTAPRIERLTNAKNFYGWKSGVFSSQAGYSRYGFNLDNGSSAAIRSQSRWGFTWNNETNDFTPDAIGGLGLLLAHPNSFAASAGDYGVTAYTDSNGIGRKARVQLYVR